MLKNILESLNKIEASVKTTRKNLLEHVDNYLDLETIGLTESEFIAMKESCDDKEEIEESEDEELKEVEGEDEEDAPVDEAPAEEPEAEVSDAEGGEELPAEEPVDSEPEVDVDVDADIDVAPEADLEGGEAPVEEPAPEEGEEGVADATEDDVTNFEALKIDDEFTFSNGDKKLDETYVKISPTEYKKKDADDSEKFRVVNPESSVIRMTKDDEDGSDADEVVPEEKMAEMAAADEVVECDEGGEEGEKEVEVKVELEEKDEELDEDDAAPDHEDVDSRKKKGDKKEVVDEELEESLNNIVEKLMSK